MRRSSILATVAAAALALAACGGGGDDSPSPAATTDGELTPITVGVMPVVDTASIWLGVDEGIFAEHGLDVTLELASGGAAIVPTVVSGDFDFGFSNVASVLLATDQGLPLTIVAPGSATTGDPEADMGAILSRPGAGFEDAGDLNGATIAVVTLNALPSVLVSHVIDLSGGDSSTVNFVEMPFPDMPAALANGTVDAAWIFEPFVEIAKIQGAELVTHLLVETSEDLMMSAYFVLDSYAEANPEIVEAFSAAQSESQAFAEANPEALRAIVSTYTEIDPSVQEAMTLPRFPSSVHEDSVFLIGELSARYGLISEGFDAASVLP